MDHRWYKRKNISLEVVLIRRDHPSIYCKCRNISMEGMFVEVDSPSSDLGSIIEVIFAVGINGVLKEYRINTCVIHIEPDGYGLMFLSVDGASLEMLEHLLHSASGINAELSQANENLLLKKPG